MSKQPSAELLARMRTSPALRGLPRAVWQGAPANWIAALQAIDQRQDKGPLLRLLISDTPISPAVRYHLADLLERYNLKRPPRRKREPSYQMTRQNQALDLALTEMRERPRGMTANAAIKKYAAQHGLNESALKSAYNGRHESLRRALRHDAFSGLDIQRKKPKK